MYFKERTSDILFLLCFVAIATIIGSFVIPAFPFKPIADEVQYDQVALGLLNEHQYKIVDGYLLSPGYPIFLASVYKLFGHNYNAVYYLQFVILGLISFTIYQISKKHLQLKNLWSVLAAGSVLFWPYLILYSRLVLTEILYTFFLILSAYFLLAWTKRPNTKNFILLTFALAITTLTRPVAILLPLWILMAVLTILFFKKEVNSYKNYLYQSLAAIFIFILLLLPWILFSSYKTGKATPVSSTFDGVMSRAFVELTYEQQVYKTPGFEPGATITPQKIIKAKLMNVYRFWNPGTSGYQAEALIQKYPYTKYLILIYKIAYYLILLALFLSLAFMRQKPILVLWLVILYFWAVHSVLFPTPRYTLPIIPLVLCLAIFSLSNIKKYCQIKLKSA